MDYPRYDPQSPVTPLTAAELDALDRLLSALPGDAVMTLDGVDGYLTALLVGPGEALSRPTAEWMPLIWGGDTAAGHAAAAPFASKRQRKDTVVLLLRHLRALGDQLHRAPDDWEPIFSVAEEGAAEWVDARDWCAGFLQAVDQHPEAWQAVWNDPGRAEALAPLLRLGGGLAGDELPPELSDPKVFDPLSRSVPQGVLMLLG